MVFPYPQKALSLNKDKKIYANEKNNKRTEAEKS